MPNISKFSQDVGLDLSYDPKVMTYLYGLSDFWRTMFEDQEIINTILEAQSLSASEVYNNFLQLTSTLSLEGVMAATNCQLKLQVIPASNLVTGSVSTYTLPDSILSAKYIANRPFLPTTTLEENVHFFIDSEKGTVQFYKPLSQLGFPTRINSAGVQEYSLWFTDVQLDQNLIYSYYGKLLNIDPQTSTESFKNLVYGMYYLYTHGPTLSDLKRGMNLVLGIPLARESESVLDIRYSQSQDQYIVTTDQNSYFIPYGLKPSVVVGQQLAQGDEITTWVEVKDYVNDGEWWVNYAIPEAIMPAVQPGMSRYATPGSASDYLMREYFSRNSFLINLKVGSFKNINIISQIGSMVKEIKPSYTAAIYVWSVPVIKDEAQFSDTITYRLSMRKYETILSDMKEFDRASIAPYSRGNPTFTRFTGSADASRVNGLSELVNGPTRSFNNGTSTGFIGSPARFMSERAGENLLTHSQNYIITGTHDQNTMYKNSIWGVIGSVPTEPRILNPDGTEYSGVKIRSLTSTRNSVYSTITLKPNTKYTFSCYLKAGEADRASVFIDNTYTVNKDGVWAPYYGSNVTLYLTTGVSDVPTWISLEPAPNGWYRAVFPFLTSPAVTTFVSRSGSGNSSYWISPGQLKYAANNVARYESNILLLEKQSENLLSYSSGLSTATFGKVGDYVRQNFAISPDGTRNADLHIKGTAANSYTSRGFFSKGSKTFSLIVKPFGYTNYILYMDDLAGRSLSYNFDLTNLKYDLLKYDQFTWQDASASIVDVGGGWRRISISGTFIAEGPVGIRTGVSDGVNYDTYGLPNFTGDGSHGVLVFGAQLENGLQTTSYIPDTFVSRSGDASYIDATGTVGWSGYNMLAGSEAFDSASWGRWAVNSTLPTVAANAANAPNGTKTADLVTTGAASLANSYSVIAQRTVQTASTPYTYSVYLKGIVGGEVVYLSATPEGTTWSSVKCVLTTEWVRYSCSFIRTTADYYCQIGSDLRDPNQAANTAQSFYAWGAQLNTGWTAMDYNPSLTSSARPGYISDSTNVLSGTTDFSQAVFWVPTNTTVVRNSVSSSTTPDGYKTADIVVPTAVAGSNFQIASSLNLVSGQDAVFSVYAKASGYNFIQMKLNNVVGAGNAIFDLSLGTVVSSTTVTATITDAGSGWYRCAIYGNVSATVRTPVILISNTSTFGTFTPDGTSGVQLYGAQAEYGTTLSNYSIADITNIGTLVESSGTNLVMNSTFKTGGPWTSPGWTNNFSQNELAPDGTYTAFSLGQSTAAGLSRWFATTLGSSPFQGQPIGTLCTVSCWLKYIPGNDIPPNVYFWNHTNPASPYLDITTTWKRFTFTFTSTQAFTYTGFLLGWDAAGTANDCRVAMWGFQAELGSTASSYIKSEATTLTRASAGMYEYIDGTLHSAAANTPRVTRDGLLLEGASSNLYTNTSTVGTFTTVGLAYLKPYSTVAPTGTMIGSKLCATTSTGTHYASSAATVVAGTRYSYSVYLKAAELSSGQATFTDGTNTLTVSFDLYTGRATFTNTGLYSMVYVRMIPAVNQWFRLAVSFFNSTATSLTVSQYLTDSTGATSFAGTQDQGYYIALPQLEAHPYASSFIPSVDTFTSRASTATYFDANKVMQTAAINTARTGYDLSTGTLIGPIFEAAATNGCTSSQVFGTPWLPQGTITVTANTTVAPDGTTTASTLAMTGAGAQIYLPSTNSGITAAGTFTISVFAKSALGGDKFRLAVYNATDGVRYSPDFTLSTTWTRYSYTFTVTVASNVYVTTNSTGAAANPIVWGYQVEAGTIATSYIPTAGAAVTRAADVFTTTAGTRAADIPTYPVSVSRTADTTASLRGIDKYTTTNRTYSIEVAAGRINGPNSAKISDGIYMWGAQLEEGSNASSYMPTKYTLLTRSAPISYFDSTGVLKYSALDVMDYDPVSRKPKTNFILGATNLIPWSNDFTHWAIGGASVAASPMVSPDRNLNATFLSETNTTGQHLVYYSVATPFSYGATASVFMKAGNRTTARLQVNASNSTQYAAVTFNLATGVVSTPVTTYTSGVDTFMTDCGNGWWRCVVTFRVPTSLPYSNAAMYIILENNGSVSYTGTPGYGIHIFGAQLVDSNVPYNYIPTAGATGTVTSTYQATKGTRQEVPGYKRVPMREVEWTEGTVMRNGSNYLPRKSKIMFGRGGELTNTTPQGYQGTPQYPGFRNVYLYTTNKDDLIAELGTLGVAVPNTWSFTVAKPLATWLANFNTFFVSSGVPLPSTFPPIAGMSTTVQTTDLREGDFLMFVKIDDYYYGAWWVTTNFDFVGSPYFAMVHSELTSLTLSGKPMRSHGRLGAPFYQLRGGNTSPDSTGNGINASAVNTGGTSTAPVVKYTDSLNAEQTVSHAGTMTIVSKVEI